MSQYVSSSTSHVAAPSARPYLSARRTQPVFAAQNESIANRQTERKRDRERAQSISQIACKKLWIFNRVIIDLSLINRMGRSKAAQTEFDCQINGQMYEQVIYAAQLCIYLA